MKKNYKTIFCVLLLVKALSLSGVARAERSYIEPVQEDWVVFLVSGQNKSEETVCAVSNTFDDGTTLYLAGNQKGLSHLSVEYPQGQFFDKKPYSIKYTIPGVQSGTLKATPLNKTTLVSEMAMHDDLSVALDKVGKIEIEINQSVPMMYDMVGFDKALKGYRDCLGVPESKLTKAETPKIITPKKKEMPAKKKDNGRAPPPPVEVASSKTTKLNPKAINAASLETFASSPRPAPPAKRYTEEMAKEWEKESKKYEVAQAPAQAAEQDPIAGFLGAKTKLLQESEQKEP